MSEDVVGFWDEQAAGFDDDPDHGLRDAVVRAAWARLLLPQMPAAPAFVADIGCGTGSLSVLLASAGHTVIGVDIAPRMIEAARRKAAAAAVDARFVVADAAAPGLAHGAFDAGLTASDTAQAVRRHRREAKVTALDDKALWGGPITDERYLLVSRC
jgi:SAM-dependent methyltransferase